MTQTPEMRALIDLNNAWNELAPKVDQGFIWRLVAARKADGLLDERGHCNAAVDRLYDGLAWGNWPSVIR